MKVLMLGWEFPPFFAGGAGIVCYELTREMVKMDDLDLTYVMPFGPDNIENQHLRILVANKFKGKHKINFKRIPSLIGAYDTKEAYETRHRRIMQNGNSSELKHDNTLSLYGDNLIEEVYNFMERVNTIIDEEEFDVVHAHDWTTFPAAIRAAEQMKKPLVVHIHITEFDKSGGDGADPHIYSIEKEGMDKADRIIAISDKVKQGLINNYYVDPAKIEVIHHAKIGLSPSGNYEPPKFKENEKIVLYAGRVTLQKGPEYFVEAAAKVLQHVKNVKFVMIGAGDMLNNMIKRTAELGISDKFVFHGFYNREEGARFFDMADVFVMPSTSEPFGLVPFEAMLNKTPSIISKQSGCSEIIKNALKVDFWDINQMASGIVALLRHEVLHRTMTNEGLDEVNGLTWDEPAKRCMDVYRKVLIGRTN